MATKKRSEQKGKRKEQVGKSRGPNDGHKSKLTEPEAEIIFVIWHSKRPIDNKDIAEEHYKYFRPPEKKSEATVRGTINRLRKREQRLRWKYILSSKENPQTHEIAKQECVHSQGTAVMLLEFKKGYLEYEDSLVEILRVPFEQYLKRKYPARSSDLFKGPGDISKRIRLAGAKGFVVFTRYGKAAGIEAGPRLDIDLPYLRLIVEDYLKDLAEKSRSKQTKHLRRDLRGLVSLFGHGAHSPAG